MAGLPTKTTGDDIDKVTNYLQRQVGWVTIQKAGAATDTRLVDARKLEAMRFIGLIERDDANIKLTDAGRDYARATAGEKKEAVLADRLRAVPLYETTIEWLHNNSRETPSKTDIANYWHDKHSTEIGEAKGDALTDAVVFFLRMADHAGIGKFISAGKGRDSHLKVDQDALGAFVTGRGAGHPAASTQAVPPANGEKSKAGKQPASRVTVADRVQLNIQIHIAADTKPATVEQIFKNMKKYVLDQGSQSDT